MIKTRMIILIYSKQSSYLTQNVAQSGRRIGFYWEHYIYLISMDVQNTAADYFCDCLALIQPNDLLQGPATDPGYYSI